MEIKRIPWLPLSALLFYLAVLLLWQLSIIPSPAGIVVFLENLYEDYGLIGLFIASFLEGIVYLGLYFPGSFIIVLSVILADGSFISLFLISAVVATAITFTSVTNYLIGMNIRLKDRNVKKIASKGLFLSMLHPNSLAFYFFNDGMKRRTPLKIALVPLFMVPYGLFHAGLITLFKEVARSSIENHYVMIAYILIWLLISFIVNLRN